MYTSSYENRCILRLCSAHLSLTTIQAGLLLHSLCAADHKTAQAQVDRLGLQHGGFFPCHNEKTKRMRMVSHAFSAVVARPLGPACRFDGQTAGENNNLQPRQED